MRSSLVYARFLNLAQAMEQLPGIPEMDPIEERILKRLASNWFSGTPLTVLQAMNLLPEISSTTVHRRLKTLRKKGVIDLKADEKDSRTKYVVPTDLTLDYYVKLGNCVLDAAKF